MDNRRLFLAVLLSLAVLLAWQYFFPSKPTPKPLPKPAASAAQRPGGAQSGAAAPGSTSGAGGTGTPSGASPATGAPAARPAAPPIAGVREERVVLENALSRAVFTNRGAQLVSYHLKGHKTADGKPLELVRARREGPYPFGLVDRQGNADALDAVLFDVEQDSRSGAATFLYRGPAGEAQKRFAIDRDGLLEVDIRVPGREGWSVLLGPGARDLTAAELESRYLQRSAVYDLAGEVKAVNAQGAKEPVVLPGGSLRWVGLQDNYYLAATISGQGGGLDRATLEPMLVEPGDRGAHFVPLPPEDQIQDVQKKLKREFRLLLTPVSDHLVLKAFQGAKEYKHLARLPYGLEKTIDLGMFAILARPLLVGLHWIHDNIVPNYGWAIILMTFLIKIALLPLTHKTYVSMQKMQQLNPKMQAIRDRYRSKMRDKQGKPNLEGQRKMNEEIMALYRSEGVNPAGGCLPMLLQLPILFAFFKLLTATVELRNAPWMFWIKDLSEYDPYYVLPAVMTLTQFIQTRMTPVAGDPMQRRMMQLMPLFMLFFFVWSPSGLVLYWLTNNILTIAQQAVYNHLKQRGATA